jgi:DNA-binding beta-propeller fold protein YncE
VIAGNTGTGFEICIVATDCKGGVRGSLGGELESAAGLTTDSAGDVYAADAGNNRIQKFDSSGNFLRTWGKDVAAGGGAGFEICTVAASCQYGGEGGLGGELWSPGGTATDATSRLYVLDATNERVQVFGDASDLPSTGGGGSQTGSTGSFTGGTGQTVNPECQSLARKLKKAKTKRAKRKIRRKLRALGCQGGTP